MKLTTYSTTALLFTSVLASSIKQATSTTGGEHADLSALPPTHDASETGSGEVRVKTNLASGMVEASKLSNTVIPNDLDYSTLTLADLKALQASSNTGANEEVDHISARQIPTHQIPHFFPCRPNDPRPYCPHRRSVARNLLPPIQLIEPIEARQLPNDQVPNRAFEVEKARSPEAIERCAKDYPRQWCTGGAGKIMGAGNGGWILGVLVVLVGMGVVG